MAAATNPSSSEISAANSASSTSEPNPTRRKPMARPALHPDRAARMGLCPRLSDLRSACRRAAGLAPSLQLASTPRRDKIPNADQPPRPIRGRPVEAPHLERYLIRLNRHSRESGNPGQPTCRLPWTPAFAGVTGNVSTLPDQALGNHPPNLM